MNKWMSVARRVLYAVIELIGLLVFLFIILYAAELQNSSIVFSQYVSSSGKSIFESGQNVLVQFGLFVASTFTGNWGMAPPAVGSFKSFTASAVISYTLPNTIFLLGLSIVVSVPIVILLGISYGNKPHSSRSSPVSAYTALGTVIPVFVLAAFARFLFNGTAIGITGTYSLSGATFPTHVPLIDGLIHDNLSIASSAFMHFILPFLLLVFFISTLLLQTYRSGIIKSIKEGYVRLARATGTPQWLITKKYLLDKGGYEVLKHIRVIMMTVLTYLIIVEAVFNYQGIGWAFYQSVTTTRNYPLAIYSLFIFGLLIILAGLISGIAMDRINPSGEVD